MIDINKLKFSDWSIQRKMESLRLMEKYLRKHGNPLGKDTIWQEWGGGYCGTQEETEEKLKTIVSDNEAYINALFCFYICLTTDLSWFK